MYVALQVSVLVSTHWSVFGSCRSDAYYVAGVWVTSMLTLTVCFTSIHTDFVIVAKYIHVDCNGSFNSLNLWSVSITNVLLDCTLSLSRHF